MVTFNFLNFRDSELSPTATGQNMKSVNKILCQLSVRLLEVMKTEAYMSSICFVYFLQFV